MLSAVAVLASVAFATSANASANANASLSQTVTVTRPPGDLRVSFTGEQLTVFESRVDVPRYTRSIVQSGDTISITVI